MPLIARQRSRLATLAVLALVGSLLAVSAAPAAAAGDGKVTYPAKFSACVGGATADAGFEDMDGSFAEDAANCLAYYGITTGTSEGMFSPNASVTRLQMALFLKRAAGPAGAALPAAKDQGFTDIGGLTQGIQDAINMVAAAKIMVGRSSTSFAPDDMVTREDMAVHLAALLDASVRGPGGTDIGETTKAKNGIEAKNIDDVFTDISGVKYSAWTAIRNIYEMGVAKGTSATTFSPSALVSRGQMAAFITRALGHTNARPMGLSAQAEKTDVFKGDTVTFVTSVRDSSFMPVGGALVDVFWKVGAEARTKAFKDDGTCVANPTGLTTPCEITAADLATDANGNIESGIAHTIGATATSSPVTAWVWTGNVSDKYDNDDTVSVSFDLTGAEVAAKTRFSDDVPENALAQGRNAGTGDNQHGTGVDDFDYTQLKYGQKLTITLQLIDANGDNVAKADEKVTVRVQKKVDEGDNLNTGDWGTNAESSSDQTMTHKTNASGTITLEFTENDPNSGTGQNDATRIQVTFSAPTVGENVRNKADTEDVATVNYEWNDDAAQPAKVTVKVARNYATASNVGSGASGSAQAIVSDQYGDPLGSKKVAFTSSDGGGIGTTALNRYTGSNGTATIGFNRSNTEGLADTITATHEDVVGCVDGSTGCEGDDNTNDRTFMGTGTFYWVTVGNGSGELVVADTDNNTVVAGTVAGTYDSNDYFFVGDSNVAANAKSMADFEKALKVGKSAEWTYVADGTSIFRVAA